MSFWLLIRHTFNDNSTLGDLSIDGKLECHTLEDKVRDGPKVPGQTAIPAGTYQLVIDYSNRFKRDMPHLLDVPGFEGVRIHAGNTDADTEGCPLVGRTIVDGRLGESKKAFAALFPKLVAALAKGPVQIGIVNEWPMAPDPDGEVSGE